MIAWDRSPETAPRVLPAGEDSAGDEIRCLWCGGFIANHRELSWDIGDTGSDSELILAAYRRHGIDAARHVAGPASFILWDGGERRLVAVRDRTGARGLYFLLNDNEILISNRAAALHGTLDSVRLNAEAVARHLQGSPPPVGETFFEGVLSLEPGHVLTVESKRASVQPYWRPGPRPRLKLPDDESYAEAFREVLTRVVAEYSTSPRAGITLSGGLDSTAVAAALRASRSEVELHAFSWVSPELPDADESREIEETAAALDIRLTPIAADQHWPLKTEPGIVPSADTPFYNYYTDLWHATFRAARARGVTELFSGMSGDHLFGGGLPPHADFFLTGRWGNLAAEIRSERHRDFAHLLRYRLLSPWLKSMGLRRRALPVPWLGEKLRHLPPPAGPPLPLSILPGRRERLRLLQDRLLPAVAQAVNQQASEHGIDFRHPLLDHRLFEFAASLPTSQTSSKGMSKAIVRRAFAGRLPDAVIGRRSKVYPVAISRRGLHERERSKVWALMTGMRAAEMGFVDEPKLREEYQRYLAGETQSALFWHTLTLEAWLRRYFPR